MTNDYTNPKNITTLTLTLTDNHDLIKKFFRQFQAGKVQCQRTRYMYWNLCLITRLILILTLYDVNLTLGSAYDALEKNCRCVPDSNLETINTKRATLWGRLFGCYAMGFVKRQVYIIAAAA